MDRQDADGEKLYLVDLGLATDGEIRCLGHVDYDQRPACFEDGEIRERARAFGENGVEKDDLESLAYLCCFC